MASAQSGAMLLPETPKRSIGLSDAAEERWRRLTGGKHVHSDEYNPFEPVPPLGCERRRIYQEPEDVDVPACNTRTHLSQEADDSVSADDAESTRTQGGVRMAVAYPTQQLLEDPTAPPLPPSLQRLLHSRPFIPPRGEDWQIVNGWYVRISRAELDQLLADAEASESGEEDVDSPASTKFDSGCECASEDDDAFGDLDCSVEIEPCDA
eukprot:TRINITY_DN30273_c0_g1_i1.p2 TRINITY_DN30273_c0_g1~~TRINITY_DN30273_c0_g1_i1.p2  ORF type:complete len:230 (-),score=33.58 TRINITY_DN30273_c0_g1_i1:277-903(-)